MAQIIQYKDRTNDVSVYPITTAEAVYCNLDTDSSLCTLDNVLVTKIEGQEISRIENPNHDIKYVTTDASQGLNEIEKDHARENIGVNKLIYDLSTNLDSKALNIELKQDKLYHSQNPDDGNIKTINGVYILGPGNVNIYDKGVIGVDNALDTSSENAISNSTVTQKFNTVDNSINILDSSLSVLDSSFNDLKTHVGETIDTKLSKIPFQQGEGLNSANLLDSSAQGDYSVAIGYETQAKKPYTLVGGIHSVANGQSSLSFGDNTLTSNENEIAFGKYNKSNESTLFSIGNGTDEENRSNIIEILNDGTTALDGNFKSNKILSDSIDTSTINTSTINVNDSITSPTIYCDDTIINDKISTFDYLTQSVHIKNYINVYSVGGPIPYDENDLIIGNYTTGGSPIAKWLIPIVLGRRNIIEINPIDHISQDSNSINFVICEPHTNESDGQCIYTPIINFADKNITKTNTEIIWQIYGKYKNLVYKILYISQRPNGTFSREEITPLFEKNMFSGTNDSDFLLTIKTNVDTLNNNILEFNVTDPIIENTKTWYHNKKFNVCNLKVLNANDKSTVDTEPDGSDIVPTWIPTSATKLTKINVGNITNLYNCSTTIRLKLNATENTQNIEKITLKALQVQFVQYTVIEPNNYVTLKPTWDGVDIEHVVPINDNYIFDYEFSSDVSIVNGPQNSANSVGLLHFKLYIDVQVSSENNKYYDTIYKAKNDEATFIFNVKSV